MLHPSQTSDPCCSFATSLRCGVMFTSRIFRSQVFRPVFKANLRHHFNHWTVVGNRKMSGKNQQAKITSWFQKKAAPLAAGAETTQQNTETSTPAKNDVPGQIQELEKTPQTPQETQDPNPPTPQNGSQILESPMFPLEYRKRDYEDVKGGEEDSAQNGTSGIGNSSPDVGTPATVGSEEDTEPTQPMDLDDQPFTHNFQVLHPGSFPDPVSAPDHIVLCDVSEVQVEGAVPRPATDSYRDCWDANHVKLPCSPDVGL
eukprot:comp13969_c0_seq2/m.9773 comp13969_c0_seq2/g.9773  ORF comp13969_c0_seq2/g.9773 comp13969_c0_seq2/m.9773 type:complete len:258 (-) comp13969_c0_seq2:37-810(-)